MKKNLITLTLLIATTTTFAQTINWGIKGGVNFAKQVLSPNTLPTGAKALTDYNLGVIADIDYGKFYLQPGLFFTTKGERFVTGTIDANQTTEGTSSSKFILTYLELPVNFFYKAVLAPDAEFHIGGGPYFAYGLAAKESFDGTVYHGGFGDHSADPTYAGNYYKNPDYGVNFIAGLVLQKYLVDVQYGLGLGNLSYSDTNTLKNRVISVSVGYKF
ncbi:outer membrane beta-barrel protein [Mucilaginibacter sp. dw_454]|uniref:outer membrane beta-barrel protein n=1 Tax=Mucilaginibacter sp. dw_454 TaxID=2720079 RepID=UPI001BD37E37|nr:outer membrane beta-barrel protein [Mucilaginibacter sp. dw_454]